MNKLFKFTGFSGIILLLLTLITGCEQRKDENIFSNPHQNLQEFAISSENCILENKHLWVASEIQTLNPDLSGIGGINKVFSPPLNLSPFNFETKFFDQKVETGSYTWKPGEIIQETSINNVDIKCLMVPLSTETRIIQIIELTNNATESVTVPVSFSASPSFSYYDEYWYWSPRDADKIAEISDKGNRNSLWYESNDGEIRIEVTKLSVIKSDKELNGNIKISPGQTKQFSIIISYADKGTAANILPLKINTQQLIRQSRMRWNDRIENAYHRLGRIKTSNPDLDLFYKRGILTLLTCEWNKKKMIMQPYYSESGIDGGAVCTYLWGFSYVSKIMPLYNPEAWKEHLIQGIKTDAMNHYAFTPITGSGTGPWYSYNQYSAVRAIYDYVHITKDFDFLNEIVDDRKVIDYCIEQALYKDDTSKPVKLINYGTNENLLELKKTGSYQFIVPSPNAERCWSYRAIDEMCEIAGTTGLNLSKRADDLSKLITKELWSEKDKWFLTEDTLGKRHFSPSIQIFDMLRCGVMSKAQEEDILSHLNETVFLSEYGVHSLSKKDPGYDLNDADWGGPGVYAGDAPELVEDLYFAGYPDKAEDLLGRILWWGKNLPYYPQAIVADNIDYRRNGRANVIAGITSTQSVLYGLLGLEFSTDGKASIKPLKNKLFLNFQLDNISVYDDNASITINENEVVVTIEGKDPIKGSLGQKIEF